MRLLAENRLLIPPIRIDPEHNVLWLRINMQAFPYTRTALCSTRAIWRNLTTIETNLTAVHRKAYRR